MVSEANAAIYRCVDLFLQRVERSISSATQRPLRVNEMERAIDELSKMRLELDLMRSIGTRTLSLTALEGDYQEKFQKLVAHVEIKYDWSEAEVSERIKHRIRGLQEPTRAEARTEGTTDEEKETDARRREDQERAMRTTLIDGTRAVFHRVEPGSFLMGEPGKQVPVTLTRPFEMMAIPVTQIVWRRVAELANARLPQKFEINADPSFYKTDLNAVEQVSYNQVVEWIRALNDLSMAGEPGLVDLLRGHKRGDVYRLPTEAEWEFVARGRGIYTDIYFFREDEASLGDYAWIDENSGSQPRPVALKRPLLIGEMDGEMEFYDMLGNVYEWVQDRYYVKLKGGRNPVGPRKGAERVIRGGSCVDRASDVHSAIRVSTEPDVELEFLGFRLARDIERVDQNGLLPKLKRFLSL